MAYVHQHKVIFRDLKPENILYNPEKNLIKICDFGWACKTSDIKWCSMRGGTLTYMSPETLQ